MNRNALLFLLIALMSANSFAVERIEKGNLVIEGIPDIPQEVKEGLRQYQSTRSAAFSGWLPEKGILVSTRFGETNQLHIVKRPRGARQQITFFDEPLYGGVISPNPEVNGLIFSRDVGGSEYYQLFFYDLKTGKSRMLTDGQSRNGGALWSQDGIHFAYSSTKRNQKDTDIWVHNIQTGEEIMVLAEGGYWGASDWSSDGTKLLVQNYISANESYVHVLDVAQKTLKAVKPGGEGKVSIGDAIFSEDNQGVYLTTDAGTEFRTLRLINTLTGESKSITTDEEWNIDSLTLSNNGRFLAYIANVDGIDQLRVKDLKNGKMLAVPKMPKGVISRLEFHSKRPLLGFYMTGANSTGDSYALNLKKGKIHRWTVSEAGGLKVSDFVEPELIRFETFDQVDGQARTIPAFYYKPEGAGPFPVLIDIHGGPEGQERPSFNSNIQYMVNELNIAVIAPNVRGSAGYGKSYLQLDNGYKREDSVKDIGKLLDWVEGRSELNADKVVVYGGSYGGYMVLAAMTHYNDRLRGGVDIVGISNFVTFLKNTKDYRRDLRRPEYGDERDPKMNAFLESISPNNHAEKITKPLFIIQGLNDPRVPASEAEQILKAVRDNKGEAWFLLAKDEGHGFRKKANRDYMRESVVMFLQQVFAD